MRVAINGFGRIGRCFLRALLEHGQNNGLEIAAINSPSNPRTLAHLLKYDSTYGTLRMDVAWEPDTIRIGDYKIPCIDETDLSRVDWTAFNVDMVLETSGQATEGDTARLHLSSGAKRVLISAPSSDADITLIPGCNLEAYNPSEHRIVSMGSCTLNCLAPTLKVILEKFGVKNGFATAIHSFTNDQRLLDGSHEDLRRARAAGQSLIPTKTGASQALAHVLPELKGKMFCSAIRAPTSTVSLLDLVVQTEAETDEYSVNHAYGEASKNELKGILTTSSEPLVSIDHKKDPHSAIIDSLSTTSRGALVRVLAWYDNEWAYSLRLIETARFILERSTIQTGRIPSLVTLPRDWNPIAEQ